MAIATNLSSASLTTKVSSESPLAFASVSASTFEVTKNNFSYNFAGTDNAVVSILGFAKVNYEENTHF